MCDFFLLYLIMYNHNLYKNQNASAKSNEQANVNMSKEFIICDKVVLKHWSLNICSAKLNSKLHSMSRLKDQTLPDMTLSVNGVHARMYTHTNMHSAGICILRRDGPSLIKSEEFHTHTSLQQAAYIWTHSICGQEININLHPSNKTHRRIYPQDHFWLTKIVVK